eukprot:144338_1
MGTVCLLSENDSIIIERNNSDVEQHDELNEQWSRESIDSLIESELQSQPIQRTHDCVCSLERIGLNCLDSCFDDGSLANQVHSQQNSDY